MLKLIHNTSRTTPLRSVLRYFARKSSIPNPHKKVITVPVITDEKEVIRYKPSISVKDDLIHGGLTKDELDEEYGEENDDNDDITIGNKASKAILQHARIHQRHIERQPEWFREKVQAICDFRTLNQIQRLVKPWMVKTDVDRINRFRYSPLGWGENQASKLQQLEDEKKRSAGDQKFVYGPDETIAYASYHLPGRFSILHRIFKDIQNFIPSFQPNNILDFGCGPATGGAAAHAVWGSSRTSKASQPIQQYLGLDISQSMLDAARIMVKDILPNHLFFARSFDIVQRALKREERYSLIICSYTLSELPSDAARQAAMQMLYELLAKDGILVVVEHGDLYGSHTVRTARHYVQSLTNSINTRGKFTAQSLDHKVPGHSNFASPTNPSPSKQPQPPKKAKAASSPASSTELAMMLPLLPGQFQSYADMGMRTLAPCTHDEVCPMYPGKKCTFMQRVSGSMIRKNAEEKFAYVVMQKVSKHETAAAEAAKIAAKQAVASAIPSAIAPGDSASNVITVDDLLNDVPTMAGIFKRTPLELMHVITSVGRNADKWTKRKKTTSASVSSSGGSEHDRVMKEAEWLMESSQSDKWEQYKPEWKRGEWARIISTPIKNDGHVILDMCMPSGQLRRFTQPRSSLQMLPGLYTAVRKSTLGGMLPVYFEGYERMLSAEENAQSAARQQSQERRRNVRYQDREDDEGDDDDEEDYDEEDDDDDDEEDLRNNNRHSKARVATSSSNRSSTPPSSSARTSELASANKVRDNKDSKDSGKALDAKTQAALAEFQKLLADQIAGKSTAKQQQEQAQEQTQAAIGAATDSADDSASRPRRGRRRPLY